MRLQTCDPVHAPCDLHAILEWFFHKMPRDEVEDLHILGGRTCVSSYDHVHAYDTMGNYDRQTCSGANFSAEGTFPSKGLELIEGYHAVAVRIQRFDGVLDRLWV